MRTIRSSILKRVIVLLTIIVILIMAYNMNQDRQQIRLLEESVEGRDKEATEIKKELIERDDIIEHREQIIDELENKIDRHEETIDKLEREKKQLQQRQEKKTASRGGIQRTSTQTFEATAYCNCAACCGKWAGGKTATGTTPTGNRTIAVDPEVITLGSRVHIEGLGDFIAEDTGSAIKGNIIDIYMDNHADALRWGRKPVQVHF